MEGHGGSVFYYPLCLVLGFAPWSIFLGWILWESVRGCRFRFRQHHSDSAQPEDDSSGSALACRFLSCWIVVYLGFFTLSATKLPNYILPTYVPLALLTAWSLERWRRGNLVLPRWCMHTALACLGLLGFGVGLGLLVAGGSLPVPLVVRALPGLEKGAVLGIIPFGAALVGWWCLRRSLTTALVTSVAVSAILLTGSLATWGAVAVDRYKAPRPLTEACRTDPSGVGDVRVGCYQYYQPSLVFYSGREVFRFTEASRALEFLQYPVPVYLFTPTTTWRSLQARAGDSNRIVARHWDLYQNCEVAVVTNR
jgi:4-amino-4-deoxy-L-arabinose transferase-like glycosyltransferase